MSRCLQWRSGTDGAALDVLRVEPSGPSSVLATVQVPWLNGLAAAPDGSLYFSENLFVAASGCGSVLKVTPSGQVSTLLQLEAPWSPTAVALFRSDIYVLEYLHTAVEDRLQWLPRVRRIRADGQSAIIATVNR